MKIDAYINLHRDCVSVRSREPEDYGIVVSHEDKVCVSDVKLVVQEAGRQRVLEEERKNVHAFVRGKWDESMNVVCGEPVTYNPFKYDHFVHAETGESVESAEVAAVTTEGVRAEGLSYVDP